MQKTIGIDSVMKMVPVKYITYEGLNLVFNINVIITFKIKYLYLL